jgi:hypothetical protein
MRQVVSDLYDAIQKGARLFVALWERGIERTSEIPVVVLGFADDFHQVIQVSGINGPWIT